MVIRNLVLGSSGFVGKPFCKYLESLGEEVVRFDIKRGVNEDCREVKLPLDNVDRVYFLAWDVGGSKYLYEKNTQISQMQWNLALMQNIFPQLQKADIPFLFVSSQLADDTSSVYGCCKRLGEVYSGLLPKGRICRLWNIYGAAEPISERSHVISDLIIKAIKNKTIDLITTGEEKRQFINYQDVYEAFHIAITKEDNNIVDVTSGKWVRLIEVANIIARLTNAKVIPGKQKGREQITPTIGKLKGWEPKVKLKEGLKLMINEIKNGI